ncbi:hypothetical protein EQY76_01020 [Bacillus subtilis]|nr:hypothetical protein EQY76_01020 [Bacillus subtilis]
MGFLFYIYADLLSSVSILSSFCFLSFLIFLNPNTITSMINMRVINNQNAGCTGDSSRLHPTAIGSEQHACRLFGNRLGLPNERKDITVIKTILGFIRI